jgi:SAM-dependent methyltransferase
VPGEGEIGKYYQSETYVSHSDTRTGLVNKLYHRVRKITLSAKRKLVIKETGVSSGSILDVGCGTGAFLSAMRRAGWNITGLEPDDAARQKAASLYNIHPLPPAALFNMGAGTFDAITMWHVLEHVHSLHDYVKQLSIILKDRGVLLVAVPNHTSADAKRYRENWAAWDVPRHLYHFSPYSMRLLMENHGLTVKKVMPMWYDSFYVSMLSEPFRHGKGNIIRAGLNALYSNLAAVFNTEKCSSVIYIIQKK